MEGSENGSSVEVTGQVRPCGDLRRDIAEVDTSGEREGHVSQNGSETLVFWIDFIQEGRVERRASRAKVVGIVSDQTGHVRNGSGIAREVSGKIGDELLIVGDVILDQRKEGPFILLIPNDYRNFREGTTLDGKFRGLREEAVAWIGTREVAEVKRSVGLNGRDRVSSV